MAEEKRGGARPGSGRKATGAKTKHYTVNLPIEEAELLEKHAAQCNMSVNKYLRELIRRGGQYQIESFDNLYVDSSEELIAAEETKLYGTDKPVKKSR